MERYGMERYELPDLGKCLKVAAMALAALCALLPPPLHAQSGGRKLSLIRDAEIEQLLRDYARPVFQAAGINAGATRIVLIEDKSFNAFVSSGRMIFINTGVLMDADTPNEVIGVLAHESGHIAGGHLARLRQEVGNAQILSVVGMLAGAAAAAGSIAAGNRVGNQGIGVMGAVTGGPELARRNLLAYQRSEEQAADRAAVRFLSATQQSARGMLRTFERFSQASAFISSRAIDPYTISHPLPQERIAQLDELARQSPYFDRKDTPELQARHDMMRAKLFGFTERAEVVFRRYPATNTSFAARYARAIATYKLGRANEALTQIDGLIRERPGNAYLQELKGQVLLESGRASAAIEPLRKAVSLAPNGTPIRLMLGQAMIASGNPALVDGAIRELTVVSQREPDTAEPHKTLSQAYAQKGNIAMAELSAAQFAHMTGDWVTARTQATRAAAKLSRGTPQHRKAQELADFEPNRGQ
jgi:predicted Zn-dependent protease